MIRRPPAVPCDRHRWHQDFYARMGCRNCRAMKRRRESSRAPAYMALAMAAALLAGLFVLAGCGPSAPRPEPVKIGDFVVYRLTGEKVMVAAVPYLPMYPEGSNHHEFYGVRFKDGREKWCKGPELQRLPNGAER